MTGGDMKKNSWFAAVDETTESLRQEAEELFRHLQAGNELAIEEVKQGILLGSKWRYAGIITRNTEGVYLIRDSKEPIKGSGPIPLQPMIRIKP
jgi:hypothetical protein